MIKHAIGVLLAVSVSGCASSVSALVNRPVVEDSAKNAVSTLSMLSDRRTVVVVTDGDNRGRFCAEPPPDTASNISAEMRASLEAEAKQAAAEGRVKFSGEDKTSTKVVVLSNRTPALDGYRTGVYALCQLHLNGGLTAAEVAARFDKLTDDFFKSLLQHEEPATPPTQLSATGHE